MNDEELTPSFDLEQFDDDICDLLMQSETTKPITDRQMGRLLDSYRDLRDAVAAELVRVRQEADEARAEEANTRDLLNGSLWQSDRLAIEVGLARQEADSYRARVRIAEREFVEQKRLAHSWAGQCGSEKVRAERAECSAAEWERRYYDLANEKDTRRDDERTEQEATER